MVARKKGELRKKAEFDLFLDIIEDGETAAHWAEIAQALGVTEMTILNWRNHPKAKKVRIAGIRHALRQMVAAGRKDWRMWHEKLKMLEMDSKRDEERSINVESLNIVLDLKTKPKAIDAEEVHDEADQL